MLEGRFREGDIVTVKTGEHGLVLEPRPA